MSSKVRQWFHSIAHGCALVVLLGASGVGASDLSPTDRPAPASPMATAAGLTPLLGPAATPPAPRPTGALRVTTIARRLLLANADGCAERRHDFGLETAAPSGRSWGAPVTVVWPDGPARAAGLQPGDLIRTINGVPWSADARERERFVASLADAGRTPRMALVVERDGQPQTLTLAGQPRCHAEVRLSDQPFINATVEGSQIVIGGGLERLLADDAELAFALAHEAAHLILGHTAPEQARAIVTRADRVALEQEADALAVELMAQAGYRPDAAAGAWLKVADASRTPLLRLMDIRGPYPATQERAAFLAAAASRLIPPARLPVSHAR